MIRIIHDSHWSGVRDGAAPSIYWRTIEAAEPLEVDALRVLFDRYLRELETVHGKGRASLSLVRCGAHRTRYHARARVRRVPEEKIA